ncbi:MAG: glycine oxidase ThiO [Acidobacteria bacterium]|nr:glycine oxidase ThiO [Acidobacteriota bacterium]
MEKPADLLIVGGGIVGLGVGWRVAQAGWSVTILERDRAGRGASWAAAGMLAPVSEVKYDEPELQELSFQSLKLYPEFVSELRSESGMDVDYRTEGTLRVALNPDEAAELRRLYDYQVELGLKVQELSGPEAREMEPSLSPSVTDAVACFGDHQVDNRRLVLALVRAFQKRGGRLHERMGVESVQLKAGRVTGVTAGSESWPASRVLIAAGSWSGRLEGIPAELCPPVRPVKGQMVTLRMAAPLVQHVIRGRKAYLAPKSDGRLLIGSTMEEMGFDTQVTAGAVLQLLYEAWRMVPGLEDLALVETQAGLRPTSRDHAPILGKTPIEGLYVATGHFRHGILLAPITGSLLRDLIVEDRPGVLIKPFGLERFLSPSYHEATS